MTGGPPLSRRRFLAGSAAAGVLATACTGRDDGGGGNTDLDAASRAAGLEKLTADTYADVSLLATAGRLGAALPPAVMTFVAEAVPHHLQALDAWNDLLTDAGRAPVTEPPEVLRPVVDAATARVADVPAAARLLLRVEDYLSQTYQLLIPTLARPEAVLQAGRASIVSHQRQAVLRYIVGLPPVGSGTTTGPGDFAPAAPRESLIVG